MLGEDILSGNLGEDCTVDHDFVATKLLVFHILFQLFVY